MNTLKELGPPIPPPCRTMRSGFFGGLYETKESKKETEEWRKASAEWCANFERITGRKVHTESTCPIPPPPERFVRY